MAKLISPVSRVIGVIGIAEDQSSEQIPANGPVAPQIGGKAGPLAVDDFGTKNDDVGAKIDQANTKIKDCPTAKMAIAAVENRRVPAVVHRKKHVGSSMIGRRHN